MGTKCLKAIMTLVTNKILEFMSSQSSLYEPQLLLLYQAVLSLHSFGDCLYSKRVIPACLACL